MIDSKPRSTVFVMTEDFDADSEIKAELTTSNGGTVRDCVRVKLAHTVIRLNVPAAVDLVDVVVSALAQLETGDAA